MFHAPMLAGASGLDLSVVWARRPEAATALAERFGAEAVGSFDELLERCDAVAFAVPPTSRRRWPSEPRTPGDTCSSRSRWRPPSPTRNALQQQWIGPGCGRRWC